MLVLYLFSVADFALVHPQRKATVRVDTDPSFEKDGGPFLPIV